MRLDLDRATGPSSIRISFTDQQLTAHGGMVAWSHFLHQKKFRAELAAVLPHQPTSPNAYAPNDIALGYLGGMLAGADKLSRVAWLQSDAAIAGILNHIPFVNRLVGWWSRMRAAGWLKSATREQRAALKRDLQPIINIANEL